MKRSLLLGLSFALILSSSPTYANEAARMNPNDASVLVTLDTKISTSQSEDSLNLMVENAKIIEDYIKKQGTSVIEELEKEVSRLRTIQQSESDPINISKIDNLIDGYNNLITDCRDINPIDYYNIRKITPYGVNHPVYSPAVAAIVSFFNMGRYYLSSELLVHAKENSDRNGTYAPYFQSQVYETSEYIRLKESLRNNSVSGSGSSTFKKGNATKDIDLYYAIHKYNYNYYASQLTITDYYDFDYEKSGIYDGLSGTAVNTMYAAQLMGVIVPYNVKLSLIR